MYRFFERHKKTIIWAIVIAFVLGGIGLFGLNQSGIFNQRSTGSQDEGVAATVNGTNITTAQLDQAATNLQNQYVQYYQSMGQDTSTLFTGASGAMLKENVKASALQTLIRDAIYAQQAKKYDVSVSSRDIDDSFTQQYNDLLKQYSLTEDQLSSYLSGQGETLAQFKQQMRANVETQLRNKALQDAVVGTINPTDTELEGYFEKNISNYATPEQIRASHILVADQATADKLYNELENGADFATLAKEYSTDTGTKDKGGDLGWFSRGQMVQEFEDAAFALKNVGDISKPVKTQYGYHIIKLTGQKPAHTPTLDEVKDQVRNDYISEVSNQKFSEWYQKVHDQSQITIDLPVVAAFLTQQTNETQTLTELEKIDKAGTSSDPYLPYYIGRIYETQMNTAQQDLKSLQDQVQTGSETVQTASNTDKIDALQKQIADDKAQAVSYYEKALSNITPDETFLKRVVALDPTNTTANYLYGKLLAGRGDTLGADLRFEQVIKADPNYEAAYIASGDLAVSNGTLSRAAQQYEAALEVKPDDIPTLLKLASVYIGLKKLDEAQQTLAKVETLEPKNADLVAAQGDLAYARLSAAVSQRDELQKKADLTADEKAQLSKLNDEIASDEQTALDRYNTALAKNDSLDLYTKIGQTYLAVGNLDKAKTNFQHVVTRSPYRADAYAGLGEVYLQQGDDQNAIKYYQMAFDRTFDKTQKQQIGEKLVSLEPSDTAARFQLANVYADQYMWSAAIRQYAAILDVQSDSLEAYRGIAEAYKWKTEYSTALQYLDRGLSYAKTDKDKIDFYKKIVEVDQAQVGQGKPLTQAGLDASMALAKLYLAQGNTADAKSTLQTVTTNNPDYQTAELTSLLVQAGLQTASQTTEAPSQELTPSSVQTPSNG